MKILTIMFLTFYHLFAQDLSIKTYQAKFLQTVTNTSGKVIRYDGLIFVKQPSKMLWQYKTPIEKNVFMNQLRVIIDEPELEQAIYTQLTDEVNLIELLNNPTQVDNKYKLTFNNKNLTQIQYSDDMENNIVVKFTDVKLNQIIQDHIFNFIAPEDYDIIRK